MKSINRAVSFTLILLLLACQEVITPLTKPNTPDGGGTPDVPEEPVSGKYANCLSVLSNETIDVATWNIENFPLNGNTVQSLTEMIKAMDPDIIAVQEIVSATNFNILVSNLEDYEGVITSGGQQKLGFIYKPSEIVSITTATEIFTSDNCAFPRAPLKTTITHVSGMEVTLIDVHLKCCSDETASCGLARDRRQSASASLKGYIDTNLPTANVIILGDWNDNITDSNTPFLNFINDPTNFKFADMGIATGTSANWSYQPPGSIYLSHLDHMLITNELFDHVQDIRTIHFAVCEPQYYSNVSDHYPVLMRLK